MQSQVTKVVAVDVVDIAGERVNCAKMCMLVTQKNLLIITTTL